MMLKIREISIIVNLLEKKTDKKYDDTTHTDINKTHIDFKRNEIKTLEEHFIT